jgi:hypothetical protein
MAGTHRTWDRGRARTRGTEPVIIRKLDTLAPRARWRAGRLGLRAWYYRPARARAGGPRQLANAPIHQAPAHARAGGPQTKAPARRRPGHARPTPGRKLRGRALLIRRGAGSPAARRLRAIPKIFSQLCVGTHNWPRARPRLCQGPASGRRGTAIGHRTGKTSAGNSPFLSENGRRNYPLAKRASLNFDLSDA